MSRFFAVLALAVTALTAASLPASAHGSHVSVGIYAGYPAYPAYPAYYPYHHYRPYWGPRVVYTAPVVYAPPPPVYYSPAPAPTVTPSATQQCRKYNGDATIDGSGDPFYGTACVFTDGRWHIVN